MSDSNFADDFDPPVIEAVKGIGDVTFSRADMDYLAQWAAGLRAKRVGQFKAELDKLAGLNAVAKAQALANPQIANVQIFEVLDQQFTPEGIKKILQDAYTRAGGDAAKFPAIIKRIGPIRQQQLASDVLSEPKPTVAELRDSLREMLRKAHRSAAGIEGMSDEELIAAVRDFQPPPDVKGEGGAVPLPGSPSGESNSAQTSSSSDSSSDTTSTVTQAA